LTEIARVVAAVTPVSATPTLPDKTIVEFELYQAGDNDSKILTGELNANSIDTPSNGPALFTYGNVDKCWLCYNPVKPIT